METTEVYIGLGSNLGSSMSTLQEALRKIEETPKISHLIASPFYQTTPVSKIAQNPYLNAVARFQTTLDVNELLHKLQTIEKELGKTPKPKEAPRPIDLDILFFGTEIHSTHELEIPHPRWQERLFVLVPLSNIAQTITVPIRGKLCTISPLALLQNFTNRNQEVVIPVKGEKR